MIPQHSAQYHQYTMKALVKNAVKPHLQEGYGPYPPSPPNAPIESKIWKTSFSIASYQPIEFQKNW